jgi:hypothetical protein
MKEQLLHLSIFHAYINKMHGSRSRIYSKNLVRQRCAERFNLGFKGLISVAKNSKSARYSLTADSKQICSNARRHKRKLLSGPADIRSFTRSPHTSTTRRTPAATIAKRRAQGSNAQIEQNGRLLADETLHKNFVSSK